MMKYEGEEPRAFALIAMDNLYRAIVVINLCDYCLKVRK